MRSKIIVVDDEAAILDVFRRFGSHAGYDVEVFSDATRALEAVALNPSAYRLVVTDLRMPGMDGLTFLKTLRRYRPNIGVILMTGDPTEEAKEEAARMEGVVFLEKPFQLDKTFKETIPGLLSR